LAETRLLIKSCAGVNWPAALGAAAWQCAGRDSGSVGRLSTCGGFAVHRQQQPFLILPWFALSIWPAIFWRKLPGASLPTGKSATTTPFTCWNLRATGPIPGYVLPGGQLDWGQAHLDELVDYTGSCSKRWSSARLRRSEQQQQFAPAFHGPAGNAQAQESGAKVRTPIRRSTGPPGRTLQPSESPSTSRFIHCASANAARIFPGTGAGFERRQVFDLPLCAWNVRSIGRKSKSAPTVGEPLGRHFRTTQRPVIWKNFRALLAYLYDAQVGAAAASVKWAKRCSALPLVKPPCKKLARAIRRLEPFENRLWKFAPRSGPHADETSVPSTRSTMGARFVHAFADLLQCPTQSQQRGDPSHRHHSPLRGWLMHDFLPAT